MEYYSAIKNNDFMKFLGKWMELEHIILSEVTQSQENTQSNHSLISGYSPKTSEHPRCMQLIDYMKIKMKEYQSVDTLILLGRWINICMAYNIPID